MINKTTQTPRVDPFELFSFLSVWGFKSNRKATKQIYTNSPKHIEHTVETRKEKTIKGRRNNVYDSKKKWLIPMFEEQNKLGEGKS